MQWETLEGRWEWVDSIQLIGLNLCKPSSNLGSDVAKITWKFGSRDGGKGASGYSSLVAG